MTSVGNAFVLIHLLRGGIAQCMLWGGPPVTPEWCIFSRVQHSGMQSLEPITKEVNPWHLSPAVPVSGIFSGQWAPFQSSEDFPGNALGPSVGLGPVVAGRDPSLAPFSFWAAFWPFCLCALLTASGKLWHQKAWSRLKKRGKSLKLHILNISPHAKCNKTAPLTLPHLQFILCSEAVNCHTKCFRLL